MTYFFTADLHLGHRKVAELRGFNDVVEHDAMVLDGINRLTKHDILWVLGDLTLQNPDRTLCLLAETPCRKRLVMGNHDRGHPMHRDSAKWVRRYYSTFEYVGTTGLQGGWLLSHFPYTADRDETRYAQWRLPNYGHRLLHGHTHSAQIKTSPYEVHVGLDAWGMVPVSLEAIEHV